MVTCVCPSVHVWTETNKTQVPSGAVDMELIQIEIRHGHLSHHPVMF